MDLTIKTYKYDDGERAKMLFDNNNLEYLLYPNVYLVDQIRNSHGSLSTMDQALGHIKFFLTWCEYQNINLDKRILHRHSKFNKLDPLFLTKSEVNKLTGDCKLRIADLRKKHQNSKVEGKKSGLLFLQAKQYETVSSGNEYRRLTRIAGYLDWLQSELLGRHYKGDILKSANHSIDLILNSRPRIKVRKSYDPKAKGLSDEAVSLLTEISNPDSPKNPFSEKTKVRNQLIIDIFRFYGCRSGELLKLRCNDFNFSENIMSITKVRNDKDDARKYEPRAKTYGRDLFMNPVFSQRIRDFINNERAKVKGAESHPYLFVSKCGSPLSTHGLSLIFKTLKNVDKEVLSELRPHALRHRWNYDFSMTMDALAKQGKAVPLEKQRKMRNQSQGWSEESAMSYVYNERFDYESSQKASLEMQKIMLEGTVMNDASLTNEVNT